MANEPLLDHVADAVLDGSPVNWAEVEARADASATAAAVVKHLQVLSIVAGLHGKTPSNAPWAMPRDVPAESWGHLRLLERIGRGAFGDVYRAWDPRLDREVALKLLPAPKTRDAAASLIIEEGRLLARVRHPGVVTIHGAEQIGDHVGLWMEYVRGSTLEELLEDGELFTPADVMRIGIELCRAIAAVHAAGVIHRDIKAQNVVRADDGRVMLMDFGAGLETAAAASAPAGTPLYLAPELFAGQPANVQSDLYSLGVLLFRLVTGTYPVRGRSISELRAAHERGERVTVREVQPKISPRLARLIDQLVDPRATQRPQTADAIAAILARIDRRARMMPVVQATGIVMMLLIAGAIAWGWKSASARTAPIVDGAPTNGGTLPAAEPSTRTPSAVSGPGGVAESVPTSPTPPLTLAAAIGRRSAGIRPSIQVLPFTNATGRLSDNWLSLALAEMLLREFRGSEAFRWIPGTPTQAALQLGVGLTVTASRARPVIPADIVVKGQFTALGSAAETTGVGLTVTLEDSTGAAAAVTLRDTGTTADLRGLVGRVGSQARAALGVPELSPEQASAIATSQPANAEAARAYAEGLTKAPQDAVDLMHQAIAADPRFAPAYAVLFDGVVRQREPRESAAARAIELAAGFPREERMLIEIRVSNGSQHEVVGGLFDQLYQLFPDTLLYGFRIALAQASRLEFHQSFATVDAISQLPGASEHDLLLELEARLARSTGDYVRAQRALDRVVALAKAANDLPYLANIVYDQALVAEEMGDLSTAQRLMEEASARLAATKRPAIRIAHAQLTIARLLRAQGDNAGASAVISRVLASASSERSALGLLADVLADEGYLPESRALLDRMFAELALTQKDRPRPLLTLGGVLYRQGEFAASQQRFEEGLSDAMQRPDPYSEAMIRSGMAQLSLDRGDMAAAREQAERSAQIDLEADAHILARSTLAKILLASGETGAARRTLDETHVYVGFRGEMAIHRGIVQTLVALDEGRAREARSFAQQAVAYARDSRILHNDRPDDWAAAESVLSLALLAEGDLSAAERAVARAAPRLQITQDRLLRLSGGIAAARVRAASRASARIAEARRELDAIVREASEIGAVAIAFDARLALGELEIRTGDFASGRLRLATLQRDALNRGFNNIARKATAASK